MTTPYRYLVVGRGEFPVDMLRYDECDFTNEAERVAALGTMVPSTHTPGRRQIAMVSATGRRPTIGRWASFGWTVREATSDRNPPFAGRVDNWQQAAGIAREQRDQAVAHLHTLLNQRLTATQMQAAEAAAREWLAGIGSEAP